MSTAIDPTAAAAAPSKGVADQLIEERIDEACRALWWAELVRESLRTLIVALMAVTVWVIVDQWVFSLSVTARVVACVALVGWSAWQFYSRIVPLLGSSIQPAYAARSLERDMPEMKQALTSYVTLRDERQQSGLRSRVVRSIGSRVAGRLKTHDALPAEATGTMTWWLIAAAVLALFVGYAALSPKNTLASVGRLVAPLASIESPKRVSISSVLPGDTDAIAGRSVEVSASIAGLRKAETVWCRWRMTSGLQETELEFDDATFRFVGAIDLDHAAMGKVAYFIEAGDAKVGPFWLSVENVPVVALQSVRYEPPAYTGEIAHTSSSGAITAVDGTKVTIFANTNRAIEKATIEFNPRLLGETVRATAGTKSLDIDESDTGLSISFPLRNAHGRSAAVQLESYRMRVWDAAQQTNPDPIVYPIRVIADLPPEVSIVMPRKTPKNLPIDGQQVIEVHAMDPDFGLKQVNLEVRRGIDVIAEPSLWSDPDGAKGNRVTEYRFRPSEHGLRVGDVVKVAAVATDNRHVPDDPSIEPNIARTDAIELRVVESEPLPEQPDGNDGLSTPDDRPASDDKGDQKSKSDSASDNTGQSDQQSGGGGGEGSSAQQDGNSGQGNQTGESKQTGDKSSESGQSSQGEKGSDAGSDTKSGNNTDSTQGGEPKQGDPSSQSDPNNTGQDDHPAPSDADSQSGQPGDDSKADPNAGTSGSPSEGGASDGNEGATQNDGSRQPNGEPGSEQTPAGGQSDSAADAPPKHDGEAFERIRDYLDKKKKEQSEAKGQQGEQPRGKEDQQSETSNQETGESESGSESEQTDRNETADGQTDEQRSGQKDSRDSQQESDSGGGNEQSTGDKTPTESEPQQSGSGRRDGSDQQEGASEDSQQKPSGQETPNGKPTGSQKQPGGGEPSGSETGEERPDGSETGDQTGEADSATGSDRKTPSGNETAPSGKEQGTNGQPKPEQGSGDQSKPEQGSGDQSKPEQGSKPDQDSGDPSTDQSGDSQERGSDDAGNSEHTQSTGQENPASDNSASESPSDGTESGSEGKPDNNTPKPKQPQESGDPTKSSSKPPQGSQSQAGGDGSATDDGSDAAPPAPAPPDLEYTKKATDMVLDYLKETRDKPDSDLLQELNWTEEDLKRFADRWKNVREVDKSGVLDAETRPDVEEALRSLGMRPQASDAALQNQDQADSLRGIRDSGNRKPPPAAYRDVFEAYRRAVGRQ